MFGTPPPPGVPGAGDPGGALPAPMEGREGIISNIVTVTAEATVVAVRAKMQKHSC